MLLIHAHLHRLPLHFREQHWLSLEQSCPFARHAGVGVAVGCGVGMGVGVGLAVGVGVGVGAPDACTDQVTVSRFAP